LNDKTSKQERTENSLNFFFRKQRKQSTLMFCYWRKKSINIFFSNSICNFDCYTDGFDALNCRFFICFFYYRIVCVTKSNHQTKTEIIFILNSSFRKIAIQAINLNVIMQTKGRSHSINFSIYRRTYL
jgi:hypothetical protein